MEETEKMKRSRNFLIGHRGSCANLQDEVTKIMKKSTNLNQEVKRSIVYYINEMLWSCTIGKRKYVPIDPYAKNTQIFSRFSDGILLCKLLNKVHKGIVTKSEIAMMSKKTTSITKKRKPSNTAANSHSTNSTNQQGGTGQNQGGDGKTNIQRAVDAALELGLTASHDVGPDNVLDLLWQIVELYLLDSVRQNFLLSSPSASTPPSASPISDPKRIQSKRKKGRSKSDADDVAKQSKRKKTRNKHADDDEKAESILMNWFNKNISKTYTKSITNFGADLSDCICYGLLLSELHPSSCSLKSLLMEEDLQRRAEHFLRICERLGCRQFVTAMDIVEGNPRPNVSFICQLYNHFEKKEQQNNNTKEDYSSEGSDTEEESPTESPNWDESNWDSEKFMKLLEENEKLKKKIKKTQQELEDTNVRLVCVEAEKNKIKKEAVLSKKNTEQMIKERLQAEEQKISKKIKQMNAVHNKDKKKILNLKEQVKTLDGKLKDLASDDKTTAKQQDDNNNSITNNDNDNQKNETDDNSNNNENNTKNQNTDTHDKNTDNKNNDNNYKLGNVQEKNVAKKALELKKAPSKRSVSGGGLNSSFGRQMAKRIEGPDVQRLLLEKERALKRCVLYRKEAIGYHSDLRQLEQQMYYLENRFESEMELARAIYVNLSANAFNYASRTGLMTKQGGTFKTWHRRYFVLQDDFLFYYRKEGDLEPKGVIHLRNFSIVNVDDEPEGKRPNVFSVTTQKRGDREFFFSTDRGIEKELWMAALMNCKKWYTSNYFTPQEKLGSKFVEKKEALKKQLKEKGFRMQEKHSNTFTRFASSTDAFKVGRDSSKRGSGISSASPWKAKNKLSGKKT